MGKDRPRYMRHDVERLTMDMLGSISALVIIAMQMGNKKLLRRITPTHG
jgi:hypothetical protein